MVGFAVDIVVVGVTVVFSGEISVRFVFFGV